MVRLIFGIGSLLLIVVGLIGGCDSGPSTTDEQETGLKYVPKKVLAPFAPITEFKTLTAEEIGSSLGENELVLGLTIDGSARAYPINMLCGPSREIINDVLDGRKIAATW